MDRRHISKFLILGIIILIFSGTAFTNQIIADGHPHSVKGVLYIDDEIAPEGIEIILSFPKENETTTTYEYMLYGDLTNYNLGFWGHEKQTGYFFVIYKETKFEPIDNKTVFIEEGVIGYLIDLHIVTPENNPPSPPGNPVPRNNSQDIGLSPSLCVDVIDPDGDTMDVSFYDASDDSLIGLDKSVPSGGTASVVWGGLSRGTVYFWYAVANDSIYETTSDIWNFKTIENQPPIKPTNPFPENGAEDVDINPYLSVDVFDPDGDTMDVTFHNASDDSIIGTDFNVLSGTNASFKWEGLSYNKTYSWYAIADDSMDRTKSNTWCFTTETYDDIPPEVNIKIPEKGLYIFGKKILPRFIRPALIIGKITIEANATDEDSGIERVDFYINGKLKGNDTTAPYEYLWKWNRPRLFHIFIIKVVAIDFNGNEASDKMLVRKFL